MSDQLKKIRSSVFGRAATVAKLSVGGSLKVGWHQLRSIGWKDEKKTEKLKELLLNQARIITSELSHLKGSLMKAGQMLSVYGEQLLPPEINDVLKTLQGQSASLEWDAVRALILEELGPERFSQLEIETSPVGSASLGQVHAAVVKHGGAKLALKVRYPGVDRAIESDLRLLRTILSIGNWVPNSPALDAVFDEAKLVLMQEVDYRQEFQLTESYRQAFLGDTRYVVPTPIAEYSTDGLIATTFEEGVPIDGPEVKALSTERRNRLGLHVFELFLKELFQFQLVQCDSHFGNFRIRIDPAGEDDKIVCLDFGAVRKIGPDFLERYRKLLRGAFLQDVKKTQSALEELGMWQKGDSEAPLIKLTDICFLMTEPVRSTTPYDYGATDLAKRAFRSGSQLVFVPGTRLPPPEMISIDRKSSGVFVILGKLGACIETRSLVARYLDLPV